MSAPGSTEQIEALRVELDALDARLLDTIRDRIACCVEIGRQKARHDIPMMQPARVRTVVDRAGHYAATNGLDPAFLRGLFERIIDETCRVETEVMAGPPVDDVAEEQ